MNKPPKQRRAELRRFSVGYYLEQGFQITVKARSAADAERIVRRRLDTEAGELKGSTRVHYDDDVLLGSQEVRS